MHSTETVDYDAIHREAEALRHQAYAEFGRSIAAFVRKLSAPRGLTRPV